MAFGKYGPRWKLMRKLTNLHMLGPKVLEQGAAVRQEEVGVLIRAICNAATVTVTVPEIVTCTLANIISRMVFSRRMTAVGAEGSAGGFKDLVEEALVLSVAGDAGDSAQTMNMEESFGQTVRKTVSLTAIARRRLSPSAYTSYY
ncbi:hypothetical protein SAY86_008096 [Trapa natans]|uniref:Uncharacterized protein n=1 Tax=Trapa natans TaxID=22666 RepID=A0AAN7K5S2_TRANT|nr:hypothetical protein SAY86_008096 [Trapa natans]